MGAAEERVIERMVEADAVAAEVKSAEATFNTQQKHVEAEKKTLAEDLASVEASLARATQQRADIVASTEPRLVALFEQVSRVRKGTAVTTATRDGLVLRLPRPPAPPRVPAGADQRTYYPVRELPADSLLRPPTAADRTANRPYRTGLGDPCDL